MVTQTETDLGIGLGLVFSLVALGGATVTTVLGYTYAVEHAAGVAVRATQITAGLAFGLALFAGVLAIAAVHVHES